MIKTLKKLWNITKANTNFPIEHPQVTTRNWLSLLHCFFSCHQAALWMVRSVRLSHLFHYVPIIVSSWNFQELSPMTELGPMQKVKTQLSRFRTVLIIIIGNNDRHQINQCEYEFENVNYGINWKWNNLYHSFLFQLSSHVFSTENKFSWNHWSISCPHG